MKEGSSSRELDPKEEEKKIKRVRELMKRKRKS